jgi:hypothetical protein
MDIIIHTYGRPTLDRQHTLRALLADGITPILVVQHREHLLYDWYKGPVHVLPSDIQKLAPTRDYLIHNDVWKKDHVVFLDDDLKFFTRREDDRTKFRDTKPGELRAMFDAIDGNLNIYPMVGIAPREGGNRNTEEFLHNTRIMRVLSFNRKYLRAKNVTFSPLVVMEDFHVNLQVLKSGADTRVLNNWCNNQVEGSDAPGGCSTYRTGIVQAQSAELLAQLHDPYVRVVQKSTKGAWGGGIRTDVIISWKKARQHAT